MFLVWAQVEVGSATDLLWYILNAPPPQVKNKVTDTYVYMNIAFTSPPNYNIRPSGQQEAVRPAVTIKPEVTVKPADTAEPQVIVKPPAPPVVNVIEKSPESSGLFALIIGINHYQDPRLNLHGAVADADAMKNFLSTDLRIPRDRIINLRNQEATRDAIVKALDGLATNPAIGPDDPILIFYAGHGAEAPAPPGWATSTENKMVQMLVPYDFVQEGSDKINGQGVFDITLSRALENLAKAKSDNISVILDCCHSGSGTRDLRHETFGVRGVELPKDYKIPLDILTSESGNRASQVAKGFETSGLRSHVLLAACRSDQTAKERNGRGAFTSHLLELLTEEGVDRLTYKDIVQRLPDLPAQNPQCEGVSQTRLLFNAKVKPPFRALFNIKMASSRPGQFVLEAGEAHGLTKNSRFAVYGDKKMTKLLGSVIASEVSTFDTWCMPEGEHFKLPDAAYAVQTHVGEGQDLRLFVEASDAFLDLFVHLAKDMQTADPSKRSFRLVDTPEDKPDFAISIKDEFVQFHVTEQTCVDYGLRMLPFNDIRAQDTDLLMTILRSAADFYWNLHHSSKTAILSQKVTLECFKLVESNEVNDDFDPIVVPELKDGREENLNINGLIMVDVDDGAKYGFRIKNSSNIPLFAALFYFDASDLSVDPYYLAGTAKDGIADYSIPANGALTIGFGDSGTPPYEYSIRDNQEVDVGFLKLYLSTQYVDYSSIRQPSPFEERRGSKPAAKKRLLWEAITIPIVQRKSEASSRCFRVGGYGSVGLEVNVSLNVAISFGGHQRRRYGCY